MITASTGFCSSGLRFRKPLACKTTVQPRHKPGSFQLANAFGVDSLENHIGLSFDEMCNLQIGGDDRPASVPLLQCAIPNDVASRRGREDPK